MTPALKVIVSWLMLLRNISTEALTLLPSGRYSTLPKNSPIRFGVSMVKLSPAITLLMAVLNGVGVTWEVSICHLRDSRPQFKNIKRIAAIKYPLPWLKTTSFTCCQ